MTNYNCASDVRGATGSYSRSVAQFSHSSPEHFWIAEGRVGAKLSKSKS